MSAPLLRYGWLAEQRLPWPELLAAVELAERLGYDHVWCSDHLSDEDGRWFADAWTSLAAILARVPRIEAGTLVASNQMRAPLLTTHMAWTLASIAPGRFVLGLGAGGDRTEHVRAGVGFAPHNQRVAELAEACALIRRTVAAGSPWSPEELGGDSGPAPGQVPRIEVLLGGASDEILRLAGAVADRWAAWGTPTQLAAHSVRLDNHARAAGRDPKTVRRGAIVMLLPDGIAARPDRGPWRAALRGSDDAVLAQLAEYVSAGVTDVIGCDYGIRADARTEVLEWFAGIAGRFEGRSR